jgi:predicted dehydrogenase
MVRAGVIGAGWWATLAHLPALAACRDADLMAIADRDGERARAAAERFGAPRWFDDHRALLALGLDTVVVATPHDTHFELARDALLAGADVLVEKPMVIEPEHGRELVELARAVGRNLHVGHPHPYTAHALALREAVRAGELGELTLVTSLFATAMADLYRGRAERGAETAAALWAPDARTYGTPERGGGQLLSQVTHAAALLLFVTGLEPVEVLAVTDARAAAIDISDAIAFRAAGGAVGTIASTGAVRRRENVIEELRVFGTRGQAELDTRRGTLTLRHDGDVHELAPLPEAERYPVAAPVLRLVEARLGREPVLVSGELGLRTAELLAAAREAAPLGR